MKRAATASQSPSVIHTQRSVFFGDIRLAAGDVLARRRRRGRRRARTFGDRVRIAERPGGLLGEERRVLFPDELVDRAAEAFSWSHGL